jgi:hypothetical protein
MVSGVFTHIPQNTKFPYIHIGKIELEDNSSKTHLAYKILFNITIYSREKNNKLLFTIVSLLKRHLTIENLSTGNLELAGLEFISCLIDQKKDGITSFANLKYKLILNGEQ